MLSLSQKEGFKMQIINGRDYWKDKDRDRVCKEIFKVRWQALAAGGKLVVSVV